MTTLHEAAREVVDAFDAPNGLARLCEAVDALRDALAQQGEQQPVAYVPVDSKLRDANWNHPNDTEKCDQQCQEALDARGGDKGQGIDGYWKWGFKAGWNAALAQQARNGWRKTNEQAN